MKTPVHNIKLYSNNNILCPDSTWYKIAPHWYQNSARGWLGSGIFDVTGKEIFEGDIVKWAWADDNGAIAVVDFYRGEFRANGSPIGGYGNDMFKIVGHVAEEQNHED